MTADLRVRLLNSAPENPKGEYVLYWSQIFRRPHDNVALNFAVERANALGVPCIFYEAIRSDYPFASDRFHMFVLEAARETSEALKKKGILHLFFLPRTPDEARGVVKKLADESRLVVSDDSPMFVAEHNARAARKVSVPFYVVDDNAVVPLALFPKEEFAARTIRPKMHKVLADWLKPVIDTKAKKSPPTKIDLPFDPIDFEKADLAKLISKCEIDHDVSPVSEFPGGWKSAEKRLDFFLKKKLKAYDVDRNEPARDGTSHLSPYLHFGMVSARHVALQARDAASACGASESADPFLEQLLVRRGLAFNFAARNPQHQSYDAIPAWAKATLAEHSKDPRPLIVSRKNLEDAKSPDEVWNAAQLELRARGVMHNYLRMLWGKLVITWTKTPREAFDALIYLNDKYALDGRDPDGYASIAWIFGVHDRPWPERAIFGKIRCMTSNSTRNKFDLDDYLSQARSWRDAVI
jgi:deoxyribodipyrimidine photo-lyase